MFSIRLRKLFNSLRENGFIWTFYYLLKRFSKICNNYFEEKLNYFEANKDIRGWNSITQNRLTWDNWDWNKNSEEWTPSLEWKEKFVQKIINVNIKPESYILEIGPGSGRWSIYLMNLAKRLYLVDISPKCIEICKKKFKGKNFIKFILLHEIHLDEISDKSLDYIFSHDVFVHIDNRDIEKYFSEFRRKIKEEGKIIIHYSKLGDKFGQFRSRFNEDDFNNLLRKYNFKIVKMYDNSNIEEINCSDKYSRNNEVISIIQKA